MAYDMGIRAYSRRRGVTHAAVQKAIRSGRISTVNGKIDPEVADREWATNTDESKPLNSMDRGQTPRTSNPPGSRQVERPQHLPTTPNPRHEFSAPSGGSKGYAAARAVRESYEARIRELDFKKMSGVLVHADEVRVVAYNTSRRSRDLLLAIPDRVSAIIAGLGDPAEVHRVLAEEIRRACDELSQLPTFTVDESTQRH